jgi:hypothetical protein
MEVINELGINYEIDLRQWVMLTLIKFKWQIRGGADKSLAL